MTIRPGLRVWLAAAAIIAAAGGRFGRRAAGRGLLALGVTRLIRMQPTADVAAAFAFASGASLELPVMALPLGGLALFSSASGLRAKGHRPRDVVVGTLSGLALGLATRRVWPVAPHDPAAARTAPVAGAEVASPATSKVVVVVNQTAGSALSGDHAESVRALLPAAEVIVVDDPDDLPAALHRAAASDVVGACGGDGTVNQAAEVAHAAGKPFLVFPGGTLNHFAKAIGIESFEDAAAAATDGRAIGVDVGVVADRSFLNVACFGAYVDLVDAREQLERRIGKWPAVVIALGRVLRKAERLEVDVNGRRRRVWMVFIGNCRYHPTGFAPSWRERLDDGQLDVRLVDATSPFSRTRLVLAVLTGALGRSRVYEEFTATSLEVRSLDGPLRLAVDGEVFDGPTQFTFEKAETPLVVLVPH